MKRQRKILAAAVVLTLLVSCIAVPGIVSNAAVVVNDAFDATQKAVIGNTQEGSSLWSYYDTSLNSDCFGNTNSSDAWAKAKFDFGTEGCNHIILGNGSNSEMHQYVFIDDEPVATVSVPENDWSRGQSEADLAGVFTGVHEVKFQLDVGTNLYDVQFTKVSDADIAALDAANKVVIASGNATAGYWKYANTAMNSDCFGNTDWGAWAMAYFDFGDGGYNRVTVGVGANDSMHAYMYVDNVFAATIAVPDNGWSRGETTVDLLMNLKGKHAIKFRLDGGTNLYDVKFSKDGAYVPAPADAPIDADTSSSSKWIWKSLSENGDELAVWTAPKMSAPRMCPSCPSAWTSAPVRT